MTQAAGKVNDKEQFPGCYDGTMTVAYWRGACSSGRVSQRRMDDLPRPAAGGRTVAAGLPRPACGERSAEAQRGRVRGTLHAARSLQEPLTPPLSPQARGEGDRQPGARQPYVIAS